ncbi:MAG: maltokinase N-terminal cap-like domain-containing protein, partial [Chloroflexota bacterium]
MSDGNTLSLNIDAEPTAEWLQAQLPALVAALPAASLLSQRWFADKGRTVTELALRDGVLLSTEPALALALVDVHFAHGAPETYLLPLAVRPTVAADLPASLVRLRLHAPSGSFWLYDAASDPACARALFDLVAAEKVLAGRRGRLVCHRTAALPAGASAASARPLGAEQSNTSLVVDERWMLKLYRHPPDGANPDVELPLYLTTRARFTHTPALGGYAEYRDGAYRPTLLALQAYIPNAGDGWSRALAHLRRLPSRAQTHTTAELVAAVARASAEELAEARALGEVTAELHQALAAAQETELRPEPVGESDVDTWLHSMRGRLLATLASARAATAAAPPDQSAALQTLGEHEEALLARLVGRW